MFELFFIIWAFITGACLAGVVGLAWQVKAGEILDRRAK
jgi:hypothetical protein